MWFKNLQIYRLPAPWKITPDQLAAAIAPQAFTPCSSLELLSQGWVSPRNNGLFVHTVNRQMMILLGTEKKLLPASVINQITKARAAEIEEQQGFAPGRKQMRELKESVTDELLPRAFSIQSSTWVWIAPVNGWLVIDAGSTGMHWQIEKGGGFHFQQACSRNQSLPLSVILGGPPALTFAAIAPLPEGIDERILASLIMGQPLEMITRRTTGHRIPARAEMVLEGTVTPGDFRREGPFGDHLGHYSHSADFPVFRVQRLLSRRNPLYPATVVGKPPQEDLLP